jgi:hypothetical protein
MTNPLQEVNLSAEAQRRSQVPGIRGQGFTATRHLKRDAFLAERLGGKKGHAKAIHQVFWNGSPCSARLLITI